MKSVMVYPTNQEYYLCENNPYLDDESQSLLEPRQIIIPIDLIERAIKLDRMNCSVRIICVCDIFMSTYYFLINYIIGGVTLFISTNGLIATIKYKKGFMCCYVYYQYIQVLSKLANLYYVINYSYIDSNSNNNLNRNSYNNSNITQGEIILFNDKAQDIVIVSILLVFQIIIACFIKNYYDALPDEKDRERMSALAGF